MSIQQLNTHTHNNKKKEEGKWRWIARQSKRFRFGPGANKIEIRAASWRASRVGTVTTTTSFRWDFHPKRLGEKEGAHPSFDRNSIHFWPVPIVDEMTKELKKSQISTATNLFRIVRNIKVRVDKKDVLRLQVRVGQLVVMEEPDGVRELIANMADLVQRIRLVIVIFLLGSKQKKIQSSQSLDESCTS